MSAFNISFWKKKRKSIIRAGVQRFSKFFSNLLPAVCYEYRKFPEKLKKATFRPRHRFFSLEINTPFVRKDLVLVVSRDCRMHYSGEILRDETSAMKHGIAYTRYSIPLPKNR